MAFVSNGKYKIIVDDEDLSLVSARNWQVNLQNNKPNAVQTCIGLGKKGLKKTVRLHNFIMGQPKDGFCWDHINGNPLDNRKSNLRLADRNQNAFNQQRRYNSKNKYKGVTKVIAINKKTKERIWYGKYKACVTAYGEVHYLGSFESEEEAYEAYCLKAEELHGEYARVI